MPTNAPRPEPTFVELVLVEPGVYWRIFDLDYQAEQFEVFHRRKLTRWTHYIGTEIIVWAFLLLTLGWHLGPIPVAVILAAALIAWYLRMDRIVGLIAGAQVLVLLALARWASGYGLTWIDALIVLFVAAAAQNISHSVEPVPPVLTGKCFESFPLYWAEASAWHRVRLLLLNLFYLPLELVSAPRLFPVHIMRAMHRFGWRRDQALDVEARAMAILGSY